MEAMRVTVVLLAQKSDFETHVLRQLAEGFRARGVACAWYNGPLDYERIAPWLKKNNVAVCLEYGRPLSASIAWPTGVVHAAWIVDYRQDGRDVIGDLGASHHLYFIMHPQMYGRIEPLHLRNRSWSMLLPGARHDVRPARAPPRTDFCLAGYIPAPLIYESPVGKTRDGQIVTLQAFLDGFPRHLLHMADLNIGAIRIAVHDRFAAIDCTPFNLDNTMQVFDDILIRTLDRSAILSEVVCRNASLDIYGPPTWMQWQQFARYYRGFRDPVSLDSAMQLAKINIHNGCLAFHYRVADALAAGAFIMVNRTSVDHLPGGIATLLEPEREYASFAIDRFGDTAVQLLDDPDRRNRIAYAGHRAVLARHTWRHRADQIIADFDVPRRDEPAETESRALQVALDDCLNPANASA
jgi:hypothetical protein